MPVNTDLPVHTAWDIGVDDAMAIWCFQVYPDHLDIVDYYEGHGQGFDHYAAWLDKQGYHRHRGFVPMSRASTTRLLALASWTHSPVTGLK